MLLLSPSKSIDKGEHISYSSVGPAFICSERNGIYMPTAISFLGNVVLLLPAFFFALRRHSAQNVPGLVPQCKEETPKENVSISTFLGLLSMQEPLWIPIITGSAFPCMHG